MNTNTNETTTPDLYLRGEIERLAQFARHNHQHPISAVLFTLASSIDLCSEFELACTTHDFIAEKLSKCGFIVVKKPLVDRCES
ncbi:MAG TPA: hypothetical protein VEF04_10565, partial [Blastocatellia bacterium]|nr:hypothetical protein [Blastocatellia bacterium]